jgi:hypothetical protein
VTNDWPQKRTYKTFRECFHIRLVYLVLDLEDAPIVQHRF